MRVLKQAEGKQRVNSDMKGELYTMSFNTVYADLIAGKEVPMVSTVKGTPVYKSSCGCVSIEDDIRRSFNRIRNELVFEKEKSRSCIYMETDFSGSDKEQNEDVIRVIDENLRRAEEAVRLNGKGGATDGT